MTLEPIDNFDQITLAQAALDTDRWQQKNELKAFLFHQNDINCLLQNKAATAIRFYLGLRTCEENIEGNTLVPDMMVVGADSDGHDLISEEGVSGVYNFALPCPRACDPKSELFHKEYKTTIVCGETERTVVHSTDETCNILAYSIALNTAIIRTELWQNQNVLRSILFEKDDLTTIFEAYAVDALRVYFGTTNLGLLRVILVGAKYIEEENYYKDILNDAAEDGIVYVYANDSAPCTMTHTNTCATESPLCHGCN